jgi:TolA-binding protein
MAVAPKAPVFLTIPLSRSYTFRAIRPLIVIAVLALSACAGPSAVSGQNSNEWVAELRALRADNARLEKRLEKLERETAVSRATPAPPKHAPAISAEPERASGREIPQLTVVKLKPKGPGKIDTAIEVQEPAESEMEALQAELESDSNSRANDDVIDLAYEKAMTALKTGNVAGGVTALMRLAADAPRHPRADNALYFAGLGQLGLNNVAEAERMFAQVSDLYPAGDAVQDAMLKLAECRLKLNRPKEARAVYEQVVTNFPGSAAATQAQLRLTRIQ